MGRWLEWVGDLLTHCWLGVKKSIINGDFTVLDSLYRVWEKQNHMSIERKEKLTDEWAKRTNKIYHKFLFSSISSTQQNYWNVCPFPSLAYLRASFSFQEFRKRFFFFFCFQLSLWQTTSIKLKISFLRRINKFNYKQQKKKTAILLLGTHGFHFLMYTANITTVLFVKIQINLKWIQLIEFFFFCYILYN